MDNTSPAWYALRRTLPTWTFEENLAELIEYLPVYRVDELIVKVDTEEFTHGQPPLDWVADYREKLFRVRDALAGIGVVYSLNPWITVGHCDRGRDDRERIPGLRTMVGDDGSQCTCCACPLSAAWRDHVERVWTLYAETRPRVMWIEDDIRTFGHLPVRYSCFCEEHMRIFSERAGRSVDREELVRAMLQPGTPHPWRGEYLDMQREIMNDTAAFLARTVHAVAPETAMGLMSSGPKRHCLDGRDWRQFTAALADGRPLYSRPPLGNYHETSLRGLYYSGDSIKLTRHCMPPDAIAQTEVENVPFTRYANSTRFTFLKMAVSFGLGSDGVTMNLFDHCGTPMEAEPAFGRAIRSAKPFLNSLAQAAAKPGEQRGVQLLFHEKESFHKILPAGGDYGRLAGDGQHVMTALESHGIPTTYGDSNVIATCGQTLRSFTDDEITAFLRKGILLDAEAALVLVERGFGEHIGIEEIETAVDVDSLGELSAEEFFNPDFGGAGGKFLTLTHPGLSRSVRFAPLRPTGNAVAISRLVDPDANPRYTAMIACENNLGGRAVVHALDLRSACGTPSNHAFAPAFNHTFRAEQLHGVMNWLGRGRLPITVKGDGVYPLAFRRDYGAYSLVGLFNLTLDPWTESRFELAADNPVASLLVLNASGEWNADKALKAACGGGRVVIDCRRPVPFDSPLIIRIDWRKP